MGSAICFTGHRRVARRSLPDLLHELYRVIETSISNGFVDFYTGGAIGFDTYCAQAVLDLRMEYPGIALHLVLPCPPDIQTARWTKKQRKAYDVIFDAADSYEVLDETYTEDCMQKRNQRLVDLADCCICYCDPEKKRTGTAQTVRMAQKKGIPVLNLADLSNFETDGSEDGDLFRIHT